MKEGPRKRDILSRPASKKAAARPRSAPRNEPKPVPVPLPEGVRHQRVGETTERSAHLEKLKQLFEAAPISRYLGMTLSYCENGVARVRLPFRAEFEERHGVIHGGLIGLLADTAGNFAVGSVSPGSTVKTVEFKMSLLAGVQEDLLAIGEVVRKGRTLATGVVAPLWLRAKCASCGGRGMFDHEVSKAQPVQAREAEEVPRSQLGGIQRRAAPPRRFDGLV